MRCRIEDRDVHGSTVHDGEDDDIDDDGADDDIDDDDDGVEIDLKQGVLKVGWARGSGAPA